LKALEKDATDNNRGLDVINLNLFFSIIYDLLPRHEQYFLPNHRGEIVFLQHAK
jgi:hypothetical protein